MSPITDINMPFRSQSAITLSSSDSSGGREMYQPSPSFAPLDRPNRMILTKSELDLTHLGTKSGSTKRSHSSPQLLGRLVYNRSHPAKLCITCDLLRSTPHPQNSYHGTSPSPRRRALSLFVPITQTRLAFPAGLTSLAVSAFGITPVVGEAYSPFGSPSTSSTTIPVHEVGDILLAPFTKTMSVA